jgi:hypothetical protein
VNAALSRPALALAAAAVLAGCASHPAAPVAPVAAKAPAYQQRYVEVISSVLLSDDGKRLAAIGAGHHYIFDAPPVLVRALHSPIHSQLQATFSTFHVDKRGGVGGDWTLALARDAGQPARQEALAIGLVAAPDGRLVVSGQLEGKRYTGWTYRLGREQDRLNQSYEIEVTTDASRADVAADEAATPIRLAADGVQLIYWAPLAPIVLPILFLGSAKDH